MAARTQDETRPDRTDLIEVLLEGSTGRPLERQPTATEAAFARLAWMAMLDVAELLLAVGVPPADVAEVHRQVWASFEGAPWLALLRVVARVYVDGRKLEGVER